jgi:NADH dehydrogenase [ubiquinone] 1 alpha subcomplex assembly factor 5
LPGALIQLRRALRPDGLFLASMPALGSIGELRRTLTEAELALRGGASPRVSPFPDLRDCAGLLQRAGFAAPVVDLEEIVVRYADPLRMLRDLRAAGETNAVLARSKTFAPRDLFPAALAAMRGEDGRVPVTMRLAMMTGWVAGSGGPV